MALYTIQTGPNRGGTIDVDTVPEGVIDQLIAQEGGQPPLLARKAQLEGARAGQGSEEERIKQEVAKATDADLQKRLDSIFGAAEQAGTQKLDDQFATERRRAIAEESALGRGRSNAMFAPSSRVSQIDTRRDNAMSQLFGNLAGSRATGQLDVAKTIQDILSKEKMFGKSIQFDRDKLLAGINENAENRGMSRLFQDQNLRQQRDLSAPEEWEKQLGRVKGITDIGINAFNTGTQAYQAKTNRKSADSAADANMLKLLFA